MKIRKIIPFAIVTLAAMFLLIFSPFDKAPKEVENSEIQRKAEVTKVLKDSGDLQTLELLMDNEQTVTIENDESMSAGPRKFEVGDEVILVRIQAENGSYTYYISDYVRHGALIWLFVLFVAVVIVVTRWQGLGSLFGMLLSFIVLFKIILPLILQGYDAIMMAILGAIFIIPITFYSSHGFSRKTTIAVFGTIVTLILTGLLAKFFADFGHITGLASEEANYLKLETLEAIDFSSLVLAGMIITILGILDDVTISQSSIVAQLKSVKKNMKFAELFKRAMQVGRDHISSLVNTLILVYAGASLPLLLLFLDHSQTFVNVVNLEFVAQEIIETLVGSIGLILAVPITTVFAALWISPNKEHENAHQH